jgi:hypothetical protein
MIRLTRFSRILLTGLVLLYVQVTSAAAVITSVYYVAEDGLSGVSSLRSIGFDGTNFIGNINLIQPVDPAWTTMHYDTAAGVMYYVAEDGLSGVSSLRSIGFDGTNFIGNINLIQPLDPAWTAMHYDTAAGVTYYVAEDGLSGVSSLRSIGFDGTNFIGNINLIQPVDPAWTAMFLVFEPVSAVPEPGTIVLLALSLAGVAATRRRKN